MKLVSHLLSQSGKVLALATLGLAILAPSSHAAKIELNVTVGNKYVLVVPGSNTGGRVVWNNQYGWITDRVMRGEKVDAWFWASNPAERANPRVNRAWLTSSVGEGPTLRLPWGPKMLTFATFTVPTSPFADNNYVNVNTVTGNSALRIPVGTGSR